MSERDDTTPSPDSGPRPLKILFTAFEPSGDDHASGVIAELKRRHPDIAISAWGGPKMQAAGANLIERTGVDAVMGMPGWRKIREHWRINARIAAWMDANHPTIHVPVDSPAANFPICKLAKKRGVKVVHLVAPQVWAWGKWRVAKLRRLTDMVLCLLPFEEKWFTKRRIPARFVGHPLFDEPLDRPSLDRVNADFGSGSPRIALMPGSRPAEIDRNFPLQLHAFRRLSAEFRDACGVVAATTPEVEKRIVAIGQRLGGWPERLRVVHGKTDAVIRWSELCLVVSGTVTLQIAKQQRMMVIVYKSNQLAYQLVGRWIVATEFFTLPNLLAGRTIVPELVPYFGDGDAVYRRALDVLRSPDAAAQQVRELGKVCEQFRGRHASVLAADAIERIAGLMPTLAGRWGAQVQG